MALYRCRCFWNSSFITFCEMHTFLSLNSVSDRSHWAWQYLERSAFHPPLIPPLTDNCVLIKKYPLSFLRAIRNWQFSTSGIDRCNQPSPWELAALFVPPVASVYPSVCVLRILKKPDSKLELRRVLLHLTFPLKSWKKPRSVSSIDLQWARFRFSLAGCFCARPSPF